jgi:membrane protein implicated in regulation of membrane protease activity
MNQSKKHSILESITNTAIAFIITMLVLPIVNYLCGVTMNSGQVTLHVILMTMISILRNYLIRRVFNKIKS